MGGMRVAYLKSLALTTCVLLAFFVGAYVSRVVDSLLGLDGYRSPASMAAGVLLLLLGAVLRIWASYSLYANRLSVLRLVPQSEILESGPYAHSRNPLFLGLIALALGWVLYLGSTFGLLCSVLFFVVVNLWVRKEERELERAFGEEYARYKKSVPRWGWRRRPL
jgi:protein-S-isoprenylcysteine O-methyltransferase Ste14